MSERVLLRRFTIVGIGGVLLRTYSRWCSIRGVLFTTTWNKRGLQAFPTMGCYFVSFKHLSRYLVYHIIWCCAEYLDIQANSAARMVVDITVPGGKANALLLQKNNLFPLSVATSLILPIKKEYTHTKAKNTLINPIPYWEHIDGE